MDRGHDKESQLEVTVRKKGDIFYLYSQEWRLLVKGTDLTQVYEQFKNEQALIRERYHEAGLEHELPGSYSKPAKSPFGKLSGVNVFATITKALIVCSIFGIILLLGGLAFVNQLQVLHQKIEKMTSPSPGLVGKIATGVIEKVARSLEELTPERRERIRQSLRTIARELDQYNSDAKSFATGASNIVTPRP